MEQIINNNMKEKDDNRVLSKTFETMIPEDFPNRTSLLQEVEEMLISGELSKKIELILTSSIEQKELNLSALLDMEFSNPAESIAAAQIIERIIEARWNLNGHEMQCTVDMEKIKSFFASADDVSYEFMPTKLAKGAIPGGIGRLLIGFPQGAREQDQSHTHPGGRIVVAIMDDGLFQTPVDNKERKMKHGTAILMPAGAAHNFSSTGERNVAIPEDFTVDDILEKRVAGTVFLSFHLGYVDVESHDALNMIK